MFLKHLKLTNFKSYEEAEFDFDENVNGIVGKNGSGKTNLLDAIYYLSFCKSYFAAQDVFSVRFDTDFFAIHGEFCNHETQNNTQVSCTYKNGLKSMRANKKEYQRLSAHIGLFPVVMVSPYDSDIINEGSETRRKFFDTIISQLPILLLDDIFDKLDRARTAELLNMVGQDHFGQVFISDTDENRVKQILGDHDIRHKIVEILK